MPVTLTAVKRRISEIEMVQTHYMQLVEDFRTRVPTLDEFKEATAAYYELLEAQAAGYFALKQYLVDCGELRVLTMNDPQ